MHFVFDLRFARAAGTRPHAQAKGYVVKHRHVPEQGIVLEHKADVAFTRVYAGGIDARKIDAAGISAF